MGSFWIFYRQMEWKDFRVNTVTETWRWINLRNGIRRLWYWPLLTLAKGHVMPYHEYAFWFRKVNAIQLYIVLSRYLAITSPDKKHTKDTTELTREGEIWGAFVSLLCHWNVTFVAVVLCAVLYHTSLRAIEGIICCITAINTLCLHRARPSHPINVREGEGGAETEWETVW